MSERGFDRWGFGIPSGNTHEDKFTLVQRRKRVRNTSPDELSRSPEKPQTSKPCSNDRKPTEGQKRAALQYAQFIARTFPALEGLCNTIAAKIENRTEDPICRDTPPTREPDLPQLDLPQPDLPQPTTPIQVQPAVLAASAKPPTRPVPIQPANQAQQTSKNQTSKNQTLKTQKPKKQEIRNLVLVPKKKQDTLSFQTAITIRNSINSKLGKLAVSTVTLSSNRNVVLGTMPSFTASYLVENQVWEGLVDIERYEIPEKWVRLVAHGVPIGSIETLKKEILAFNSYSLRGDPRWLTEARRPGQGASSIVFLLPKEEKPIALREGLVVAGRRLKIEAFRPRPLVS